MSEASGLGGLPEGRRGGERLQRGGAMGELCQETYGTAKNGGVRPQMGREGQGEAIAARN